jgi:hypothetical protein
MVEDFPVDFLIYESGKNIQFDHFFRNSFMHFYLRTKDLQDLDKEMRLDIARHRCQTICDMAKFLVAVDKEDPNVFYSYIAFTLSESQLFVHFAYTKKSMRGFGFFQRALRLLKLSATEFYYTLPTKLKKKTYLPEFEKRVL